MKNRYRFAALLLLLILSKGIVACPFIITNDTDTVVLIVDPFNHQALYLTPDSTAEIDPSIPGWQYYFYHEKLDIYVSRKDNPDLFYRRYQLVEKYCTTDKTKLTLSTIIQFVNQPSDRFSVSEFTPHKHSAHTH